jgi:uncharacterized protein YjbI with pentapeptide repeats
MAKKANPSSPAVPLKLQGKSVFLAGRFYPNADDHRERIKLEGGKVVNELTDKTDIMVLGYSGVANPQKKAAKLNAQGAAIQILSRDQFEQQIKPTSEEAVQLLLSGPEGIERWNRHCTDTNHVAYFSRYPSQGGKTAYIRGADFSNADLSNANLGDLVDHCDFTGAKLAACYLNLSNCQLKGAKLDGVVTLNLVDCTAENVDFSRIAAGHTHIESSNLTGSRFASSKAFAAHFARCQLDGADLSGLQASHSIFHTCSMKNARFIGANLEEADFVQSDLSGADFTNANLKLAKFTGAKVDGANFTGATMIGADIAQVDFSKAKGFDPAKVQATGGPGVAVKEFLKVGAQAQRLSTSLSVALGTQAVVLTIDHYPSWTQCHDSAGNRYHTGQRQTHGSSANLWHIMATKWHGATPNLASVTLRAAKAQMAAKELKQLALRAWCELFGVEVPSDDDLKKAATSTKAQKKEKTEELLALLRTGKKGVAQWNENSAALSKILHKVSSVDLAGAKLGDIKLQNMDWKNVNLSGADLAKAEVHYCRFPEGNFVDTNFKGAHLGGSSFHDANLENADFASADLSGTSFKRANCKGVKFAKTKLQHADLCGADFTGAQLTDSDLTQASYDEHTRWPKGFTPTLEMVWKGPGTSPAAHKLVQSTKPKGKLGIEQFMTRLEELTDAAKLAKALAMLKADRFRLYAQVNDNHFVGVVKSQSDADLVYSCRLNADGTYACCTQNLNICGGLRGSLCKHLLVLIVGLTKNNELDPNVIDTWIRLSRTNKPALDKDAMSETFLRYKGAEAGEVDWRPTETIPEDYYAM